MFDRLIAGAGAVTDLADRAVRAVLRAAGSRIGDTRPGSVALAAILLLASGGLVLVGWESLTAGGLRTMGAGDVPDDDSLGGRIHATVEGGLSSSYVETYRDTDGDGTQDEGETVQDWGYWMVDPATRNGVTVVSIGAPWEVFTATYSGEVVTDRAYVRETPFIGDELAERGVTLDPDHVIDARVPGTPTVHVLGDALPADGAVVTLAGSRTVGYATSCTVDVDGDGQCSEDEVDAFDVAIFDRATGVGILVVTDEDPDLLPVSYTGILRRDPSTVSELANAPGPTLEDFGITVSPTYVLDVGATPADPGASLFLALLAGLAGVVILAGLAGGYVGFRKTGARPAGASTMLPEASIPVRLTGIVRSPVGDTHVRDVPAILRRFETSASAVPESADAAPAAPESADDIPIDSTLIVERVGRPEGVALGMGELQKLSVGSATTFRGSRPAIRATAGTGPLILSFDDAATRDLAAAELVGEAGLDLATPTGPDAAPPTVPDAPPPTEAAAHPPTTDEETR
jgi:hypothetical protein